MIYRDDIGRKISSPYSVVSMTTNMVYDGEDTDKDNYSIFDGGLESFNEFINDDLSNYNEEHHTEYKLTKKQREELNRRYLKLRKRYLK